MSDPLAEDLIKLMCKVEVILLVEEVEKFNLI